MIIHQKVSIWVETIVPEEMEKKILEDFQTGQVKSLSEALLQLTEKEYWGLDHGVLNDTEQEIERDVLSDEPTVKIFLGTGFYEDELLWDNTIPIPMDYETWLMGNEDDINIELATIGADRELDFNPEKEFLKRYIKYVQSFIKIPESFNTQPQQ
jgi:hypothetical protein